MDAALFRGGRRPSRSQIQARLRVRGGPALRARGPGLFGWGPERQFRYRPNNLQINLNHLQIIAQQSLNNRPISGYCTLRNGRSDCPCTVTESFLCGLWASKVLCGKFSSTATTVWHDPALSSKNLKIIVFYKTLSKTLRSPRNDSVRHSLRVQFSNHRRPPRDCRR
jgi:hypothetical protein